MSNFKGYTTAILGEESLDRAQLLLAGIAGGFQKAVKSAMTRTVSSLKTQVGKEIREEYAVSQKNLRPEQSMRVNWQYNGSSIEATVLFSGHKIPLYRYDGTYPKVPTPDTSKKLPVIVGGKWRIVLPSIATHAHQKKSTSPTKFEHAFVATMESGHTGIFERTGGVTSNSKDEIVEIMGKAIPEMLENENVKQGLSDYMVKKFDERLDHEVNAILNGWRQ